MPRTECPSHEGPLLNCVLIRVSDARRENLSLQARVLGHQIWPNAEQVPELSEATNFVGTVLHDMDVNHEGLALEQIPTQVHRTALGPCPPELRPLPAETE